MHIFQILTAFFSCTLHLVLSLLIQYPVCGISLLSSKPQHYSNNLQEFALLHNRAENSLICWLKFMLLSLQFFSDQAIKWYKLAEVH